MNVGEDLRDASGHLVLESAVRGINSQFTSFCAPAAHAQQHAGPHREGRPPNTQTTGFCGDASTTARASTAGAFNAVADAFVEHRSPSCEGAASLVTAMDWQRRRGIASQLGATRVVAIRRDLQLSKAAARLQHI